jgi:hypothetical protein
MRASVVVFPAGMSRSQGCAPLGRHGVVVDLVVIGMCGKERGHGNVGCGLEYGEGRELGSGLAVDLLEVDGLGVIAAGLEQRRDADIRRAPEPALGRTDDEGEGVVYPTAS